MAPLDVGMDRASDGGLRSYGLLFVGRDEETRLSSVDTEPSRLFLPGRGRVEPEDFAADTLPSVETAAPAFVRPDVL
jgi:hypothetical protein